MTSYTAPASTGTVDNFGVPINVGDTVRVMYWGAPVRLGDCGRTATVTGVTRSGNLTHDAGDDVAAGRAISPGCVGVLTANGGYVGNAPA